MQPPSFFTGTSRSIICVSGDYRSGKSNFSMRLAHALEFKHFSMRKMKNVDQSYVDWKIVLDREDNQKIDQLIIDRAREGTCVLDFRYSALLCFLNDIPYYGIWISASLDVRIVRNAFRWNKSEQETACIITAREEEEVHICRTLYGKSFRDSRLYHLSIDLSPYFLPVDEPLDTSPAVSASLHRVKESIAK